MVPTANRWWGVRALLFALTLVIPALAWAGDVDVRGYFRRDGTYVRPHYRSVPDGNPYNNWSYPGNVNPYTGKVASGNPETYLRHYYDHAPGIATQPAPLVTQVQSPRRLTADEEWAVTMQQALAAAGFDPGPIDGKLGPRTVDAAVAYLKSKGIDVLTEENRAESALNDLRETHMLATPGKPLSPPHAHRDVLGNWECDRGHFQYRGECRLVQVPENARLDFLGHGWECDRGYFKYENRCLPVVVPANAQLDFFGHGWECKRGFYQAANQCLPVVVPQNAQLNYFANGWVCNSGFVRIGSTCVRGQAPTALPLRQIPVGIPPVYSGPSYREYDVSGTADDGNSVTGTVESVGGGDVQGEIELEDGSTVSFDGEWVGRGEIEGYDEEGNYYDLEVD